MQLFTIGFTQKSAERFFQLLLDARVSVLIDIRLNPDGQLSGFAKRADLPFLLEKLIGCSYRHEPLLAPTADILGTYRTNHDWTEYVRRFEALADERAVPESLDRRLFEQERCGLLCSEATPDRCHRRLVAERIARLWPDVTVQHLV